MTHPINLLKLGYVVLLMAPLMKWCFQNEHHASNLVSIEWEGHTAPVSSKNP